MNISTKNPIVLAAIGIGAFWLLTQRKASAATLGQPAKATQAASTRGYLYSPSVASQYAAYGQGRIGAAQQQQSTVSQGMGLLSKALDIFKPSAAATQGIYTGYIPGTLGTGQSAEADLSSGEAQAREYYSTHADDFVVNPPVITQDMQDRALLEGATDY